MRRVLAIPCFLQSYIPIMTFWLLVMGLPPLFAQTGVNLLNDPSFESGTLAPPFVQASNGTLAIHVGIGQIQAHSGIRYLTLTASGQDSYSRPFQTANGAVSAATQGDQFNFSIWAKASQAGIPVQLRVFSLDHTYAIVDIGVVNGTATANWQEFSMTYTCPANTAHVGIRVDNDGYQTAGGSVDVYWDDASLVKLETNPPVFHLAFEEGSGTTTADFSGNGHHGTVNSGMQWSTEALVGGALYFDGSGTQFVTVPADPAFDFAGDYTVSAWVNPDPAALNGVLGIAGKNGDGWGISLVHGRANFGRHGCSNFSSTTVLEAHKWYYLVGVYRENGTEELFVADTTGILETTTGSLSDGNCNNDQSDVIIGRHRADTNKDFKGWIDEVKAYDQVLTQTDILELIQIDAAGAAFRTTDAETQPLDIEGYRGLINDNVFYSDLEIDNVNTMNGNLVVNIPVGQRFKAGPNFEWGLNLVYNANCWELAKDHPDGTPVPDNLPVRTPMYTSNAGACWKVDLGRLFHREDPNNGDEADVRNWPNRSDSRWLYIAPDGSRIYFEHDANGVFYSIGESLIRLVDDTDVTLEFPDGMKHTFSPYSGADCDFAGFCVRLTKMEDSFGNEVTVNYLEETSNKPKWEIKDAHRTVTINFNKTQAANGDNDEGDLYMVVDNIVFPAFTGTATWDFEYVTKQRMIRGCKGGGRGDTSLRHMSAPLLSKLKIPESDTGEYTFTTHATDFVGSDVDCNVSDMREICEQTCDDLAAKLEEIELPTLSRLKYDWGTFSLPTSCSNFSINPNNQEEGPDTTSTYGVVRREVRYSGGSFKSWTTYDQQLAELTAGTDPNDCHRAHLSITDVVQGPAINNKYPVTRQYHAVSRTTASLEDIPNSGLWHPRYYGLPANLANNSSISPSNFSYNQRVYLSKEEAACNNPAFDSSCTDTRKTYLAHAIRRAPTGCLTNFDAPECARKDDKILAKRQTYEDADNGDKFIDTMYSLYDGLGRFRQEQITSNFENNASQTIFTHYNPGVPNLSIDANGIITGNQPRPSVWLFNLMDRKEVTRDNRTTIEKYIYDSTGFLQCRRTLAGTSDSDSDLAVYFTKNAEGFPIWEEYRGGDGGTIASCEATADSEFVLNHIYQYGQLRRSQYKTSVGGTNVGPLVVDKTINQNTGLTSKSCDHQVNPTHCVDFDYDKVGRLTDQKPAKFADIELDYTLYGGGGGGKVAVKSKDNTTVLDEAEFIYDAFGREIRKRHTTAAGWVRQDIFYNTYDWTTTETTFQTDDNHFNVNLRTRFDEYDIYGRVGKVTNPEGDMTRYGYGTIGRIDVRATEHKVGSLTVREREAFDNLERAVELEEGAVKTGETWGAPVRRQETFFAGDRTQSKMSSGSGGGSQSRYVYTDGRGFTYREQHPEFANLSTYYEYDSRGNLIEEQFPGSLVRNHQFDKANRRTRVYDNNGKNIKEFSYNTRGQLTQSIRHNYLTSANTFGHIDFLLFGDAEIDIQVIEDYSYNDQGLLNTQTTTVVREGSGPATDLFKASQSWTYTVRGEIASVTMPNCTVGCNTSGAPARTLDYLYAKGDLTHIQSGGTDLIQQTYHANGVVKEVSYFDGSGALATKDEFYTVGTNGESMRRIRKIRVVDAADNLLAGTGDYAYDDSGNITGISSTISYTYDTLSRLTESSGSGVVLPSTYSYDVFDNQLTALNMPFGINQTTNRLNTLDGLSVSYDDRGNLTHWGCFDVNYDAMNQRFAVQCDNGNGGFTYQGIYLSNASDQRVVVLDRIPYDSSQVPDGDVNTILFLLRDQNGKLLREFRSEEIIPGGGAAWTYKDYVWAGDALRAIYDPAVSSDRLDTHLDHLGSLRLITIGQTVDSWQGYGAFGRQTGNMTEQRIGFTGHELERTHPAATEPEQLEGGGVTYNMIARGYLPGIARFLSPDPAKAGWNHYAYASNNPITRVDRTGLADAEVSAEEAQQGDSFYDDFSAFLKAGGVNAAVGVGGLLFELKGKRMEKASGKLKIQLLKELRELFPKGSEKLFSDKVKLLHHRAAVHLLRDSKKAAALVKNLGRAFGRTNIVASVILFAGEVGYTYYINSSNAQIQRDVFGYSPEVERAQKAVEAARKAQRQQLIMGADNSVTKY